MDNDGTGTVYIKNITFTGADDEAIEWDGGNLDVRDSYFIDNDYDIYGGPDSGNGDLTLVNVVFSIGDDTQGSDRPVTISWREPLQTLTVIICNSSFDAGGDPSISVRTVRVTGAKDLLICIWRTMSITLTTILSSVMVSP